VLDVNLKGSLLVAQAVARKMVADDQQRLDLLEIFEERYRRKSTLITAQLPVAQGHDMIGEPTIADAISTGSSATPIVLPSCEGKKPRAT
jgi:IstB-like ATP binding protein